LRAKKLALLSALPAILWAGAPFVAFGQEESRPEPSRRVCVFAPADLSPGEAKKNLREVIAALAVEELSSAGFQVLPLEKVEEITASKGLSPEQTLLGPAAVETARELGAGLALTGFYRVEENRLLLELKVYDTAQGRLLCGALRSGWANLTLYNLVAGTLEAMQAQIIAGAGPAQEKPPESQGQALTLLSSDEGMEVLLAGVSLAGRIDGGRLKLPGGSYLPGTELFLEKRKQGWHSSRERIQVPSGETEVALKPLSRKHRWAAELAWTTGQLSGAGLGGRFYLRPDRTFIATEQYFYVQKDFQADGKPLYHHDLRFLVGQYLLPGPGSPLRFGVSAGGGAILTFSSAQRESPAVDYYLNPLNLFLELDLGDWSLLLRQEGIYSLGLGSSLLGRGWLLVNGQVPPLTLGVVRKW